MYLVIVAGCILMSIGVGWSIGANDAANSIGTAVGSRVVTLRQGIVLVVFFGLLGAMLLGGNVAKTVGSGIAPLDTLSETMRPTVALTATLSACTWVVLATLWKMPISTSHSIVGAVAGCALALGLPVNWKVMQRIFLCWVLTPGGAALMGYAAYRILQFVFPRVVPPRFQKRTLTFLILASACYVAFSWGANDVANATGVLSGTGILSVRSSVALGGLAIALGIVTWGYRVIETIGSQITHLLPLMAFSAQLASGLNVHLYTELGIPVSTSHSIVGAIFGVGLVRGLQVVNVRIMREIVVCWVATPFVSGVIGFCALKALVWGLKI